MFWSVVAVVSQPYWVFLISVVFDDRIPDCILLVDREDASDHRLVPADRHLPSSQIRKSMLPRACR
jgi:hypothetical protein